MTNVTNWTVRQTTQEEINSNMPYLTSSMIEAITTCPKWGIIHNVQHKRFVTGYRQMALEAGSLMHDVFAGYNLLHLAALQGLPDHARLRGQQLFTEPRMRAISFDDCIAMYLTGNPARAMDKLAYGIIGTSDYYDDPSDKNRTLANLEHAALELTAYFLMNHARFTILVTDEDDPTSAVGIEQSLDVVFSATTATGQVMDIRFIGLADTVYRNAATKVVTLGEYKTTSTMADGWREAFKTRHQLTAYNGALSAYYPNLSYDTILTGSAIPVRKTTAPVQHFVVDRYQQTVNNFLATALFARQIIETWKDENAINAPMFTHSCNRYFRPCSLIDLCSSEHDDQIIMHEQMTIDPDMSPSELKALLRKEN